MSYEHDDPMSRLAQLASMEKLSDSLQDRDAGELFQNDLEEARQLAVGDERFRPLVEGLEARSLGDRLAAVNRFFASIDDAELAAMQLPMHLGQLRMIYLNSR